MPSKYVKAQRSRPSQSPSIPNIIRPRKSDVQHIKQLAIHPVSQDDVRRKRQTHPTYTRIRTSNKFFQTTAVEVPPLPIYEVHPSVTQRTVYTALAAKQRLRTAHKSHTVSIHLASSPDGGINACSPAQVDQAQVQGRARRADECSLVQFVVELGEQEQVEVVGCSRGLAALGGAGGALWDRRLRKSGPGEGKGGDDECGGEELHDDWRINATGAILYAGKREAYRRWLILMCMDVIGSFMEILVDDMSLHEWRITSVSSEDLLPVAGEDRGFYVAGSKYRRRGDRLIASAADRKLDRVDGYSVKDCQFALAQQTHLTGNISDRSFLFLLGIISSPVPARRACKVLRVRIRQLTIEILILTTSNLRRVLITWSSGTWWFISRFNDSGESHPHVRRSPPHDCTPTDTIYGVYDDILYHEFSQQEPFQVNPQYALPDFEKPGVDPEYAVVSLKAKPHREQDSHRMSYVVLDDPYGHGPAGERTGRRAVAVGAHRGLTLAPTLFQPPSSASMQFKLSLISAVTLAVLASASPLAIHKKCDSSSSPAHSTWGVPTPTASLSATLIATPPTGSLSAVPTSGLRSWRFPAWTLPPVGVLPVGALPGIAAPGVPAGVAVGVTLPILGSGSSSAPGSSLPGVSLPGGSLPGSLPGVPLPGSSTPASSAPGGIDVGVALPGASAPVGSIPGSPAPGVPAGVAVGVNLPGLESGGSSAPGSSVPGIPAPGIPAGVPADVSVTLALPIGGASAPTASSPTAQSPTSHASISVSIPTAVPTYSIPAWSDSVPVPSPTAGSSSPHHSGSSDDGSTSQCNTGSIQCCNKFGDASSDDMRSFLLGIDAPLKGLSGLVGAQCSPIDPAGLANGECKQAPVCCKNDAQGGLVSIGCVPITL
ncbi:hypothetical protein A0H81_07026 [Grifola frondosa]|uniref:Hydrophobin n=1 Tax=Grifola frondosa TaxID=5627 RepID=A0A1C7M7S6_GRIFR|nr:hypothetical protein A0H81_07026 [Grifola frondosa]